MIAPVFIQPDGPLPDDTVINPEQLAYSAPNIASGEDVRHRTAGTWFWGAKEEGFDVEEIELGDPARDADGTVHVGVVLVGGTLTLDLHLDPRGVRSTIRSDFDTRPDGSWGRCGVRRRRVGGAPGVVYAVPRAPLPTPDRDPAADQADAAVVADV